MQSSDIRWLLGGLFIAFLLYVALSDVIKRKASSSRKSRRPQGFRPARPDQKPGRNNGWKAK